MSSTAGMELSIAKLTSPRRRKIHSARFTFDNDLAPTYSTSYVASPHGSSPSSPLWGGTNGVTVYDDMLSSFEHHRVAIPFKWEESPGTCRDDVAAANGDGLKSVSESEQELSSCLSNSSADSRSSTGGTGNSMIPAQGEVDNDDDDEAAVVRNCTVKPHLNRIHPSSDANANSKDFENIKHDTEGQSKGQILPLKPPPGMQSIKQPSTLENDERSIINSTKPRARRSFRRDGLKALQFLATSSPKREQPKKSGLPCTMLGFEEWPKVVQEQEKQQQQQQQEENWRGREEKQRHRRAATVTRFSFTFRKNSTTEKESSPGNIDFLDGDDDDIFNEDFGKKGGLMDRRPLTSLSSRTSGDGHRHFKNRTWVYDSDTDYSNCDTDTKMDYFNTSHVIAEEDEKDEQQDTNSKDHPASNSVSTELSKEKRKKHHRNPLTRVLGLSSSNSSSSGKDHHPRKSQQKPSRLSSVSPAPPPPPGPLAPTVAPVRNDPKQKTALHGSTSVSSNPLLKMCLSTPIGQALIKNVKHLRSSEFHTPRALTAK